MSAKPTVVVSPEDVFYPESDRKPIAETDLQYQWIVTIKENLDTLLTDAYVGADLFWYPVQGNPREVLAPDTMVAFGRPKGPRGSYKQWEEDDIAPRVVFEILSPSNTPAEMARKRKFYRRHGVEEYYEFDPESNELSVFVRTGDFFAELAEVNGWTSPLLGVRFELDEAGLRLFKPNGERFLTFKELSEAFEAERGRAKMALAQAEQERQRADQERARADRLAERLRVAGIDPDAP